MSSSLSIVTVLLAANVGVNEATTLVGVLAAAPGAVLHMYTFIELTVILEAAPWLMTIWDMLAEIGVVLYMTLSTFVKEFPPILHGFTVVFPVTFQEIPD